MPKKILLIRFSSIGDIVLTSPVIRCLKKQIPDAEIHFVTKKQFSSLLEANPYLHKLHLFEEKKLPSLMQQLADEKFDHIIDLHHNMRSFLIKSNLNINSNSFQKLNFRKWLMVNLKINRLPEKHIVSRYLETVKELGVVDDGEGLDHFIPEKDKVDLSVFPEIFQQGYYVFVIGAKHNTKKLPIEKAIELCKQIAAPVLLIGGREDHNEGEEITSSNPLQIINTCGKYSINQSASLIQQSIKVFAHDTGMMHIAAALKKEVISIWGNTIPEFGMYPYYGKDNALQQQQNSGTILEVKDLYCRPCSKIGFDKCPKGHFRCMRDLDLSKVPLLN